MSLDAPEPPDLRRTGSLPRWLEWITAVSALVVSVSSIFIALHNEQSQDKLVKATSYPYLDVAGSDQTPDGIRRISVDLVNQGVGPAHEQSLTIKVGDHYATSYADLIAATFGPADAAAALEALQPTRNIQPTRFIPANSSQFVFRVLPTKANDRWWRKLDDLSPKWVFNVCYCSVFKECWTRRQDEEPVAVKACHRDEAREYNN